LVAKHFLFEQAFTGVGIVVGAPVAGVAASTGAASTGLTVLNKKLDCKVDKHSRLHSLAIAKHDLINSSVSQALNDNHRVSDTEFQLIIGEMQKYRQLKETLRSNFAQKQTNSRQPDLENIKYLSYVSLRISVGIRYLNFDILY